MKAQCVNCGSHTDTLSCDRCFGNFCENCRINHNLFRLHCAECYHLLGLDITFVDVLIPITKIDLGGLQR